MPLLFILLLIGFGTAWSASNSTYEYVAARDNEEFPWFCMLYDEDYQPFCYCSIIGPNAIVTAAKCFDSRKDNKNVHIRYGSIAANSFRKMEWIEKIIKESETGSDIDSENQIVILKPKSEIKGAQVFSLEVPNNEDLPLQIATFHSYGTSDPMKTHVHIVKTTFTEKESSCPTAWVDQFCVKSGHPRCNIGLGAGAVAVDRNKKFVLVGVATHSIKCNLLKEEDQSDLFAQMKTKRQFLFQHIK